MGRWHGSQSRNEYAPGGPEAHDLECGVRGCGTGPGAGSPAELAVLV